MMLIFQFFQIWQQIVLRSIYLRFFIFCFCFFDFWGVRLLACFYYFSLLWKTDFNAWGPMESPALSLLGWSLTNTAAIPLKVALCSAGSWRLLAGGNREGVRARLTCIRGTLHARSNPRHRKRCRSGASSWGCWALHAGVEMKMALAFVLKPQTDHKHVLRIITLSPLISHSLTSSLPSGLFLLPPLFILAVAFELMPEFPLPGNDVIINPFVS